MYFLAQIFQLAVLNKHFGNIAWLQVKDHLPDTRNSLPQSLPLYVDRSHMSIIIEFKKEVPLFKTLQLFQAQMMSTSSTLYLVTSVDPKYLFYF